MSTLTLRRRRDPFADFDAVFRAFSIPAGHKFVPAAELVQDGDDAVVRLELPGLDAEKDISVEIEKGVLVVSGERRDERRDERSDSDDRWALREVRYGAFRRAFRLPAQVTDADVSASYDAGVLTVRVAGVYAGSTPTRIPVTAGAPVPAESVDEAKAA